MVDEDEGACTVRPYRIPSEALLPGSRISPSPQGISTETPFSPLGRAPSSKSVVHHSMWAFLDHLCPEPVANSETRYDYSYLGALQYDRRISHQRLNSTF